MKKYIKLSLLLFCLWCNKNAALAQENPQNLNDFKYQDTLRVQLQKHGLDMYALPALDPCARLSKPPLLRDNPFEPGDSMPSDSVVFDTTTLVVGDGGLGKLPGEKNIIWLHGLNGNIKTWERASYATQVGLKIGDTTIFRGRKVNCIIPQNGIQSYSEKSGIALTAYNLELNVQRELQVLSNRTEKDFIIGHSQGGIVGREWLRQMDKNPQTFQKFAHGLVTFGTPHDGAEILNNTRPLMRNKVPGFIQEGCESLLGARVGASIRGNFYTRLFLSDYIKSIVGGTCSFAANTIVPIVLDNYHVETTKDYYNGAPFLTGYDTIPYGHEEGLSEYTLKVPVVQFYGVEEQPILWKFMSSVFAMGEDSFDNKQIYFGYSKDDLMEQKVNNMINEFDALYNYEKSQYDYWSDKNCGLTVNRYTFLGGYLAGVIACQVEKGRQKTQHELNMADFKRAKIWLTNANDYYLTDIVGARITQTVLNCRVVGDVACRDDRYNGINSGVPAVNVRLNYNYNTNNSSCREQSGPVTLTGYHFQGHSGLEWRGTCTGNQTVIPNWVNVYTYKPNDGVVLAESAGKEIKVDKTKVGVTHVRVQMYGDNHDQMKNSGGTKDKLNALYNGDYGSFFKSEPK